MRHAIIFALLLSGPACADTVIIADMASHTLYRGTECATESALVVGDAAASQAVITCASVSAEPIATPIPAPSYVALGAILLVGTEPQHAARPWWAQCNMWAEFQSVGRSERYIQCYPQPEE